METQFRYITDLAKKYKAYFDQPALLYQAVNALPQEIVEAIYNDYGNPENPIRPVNLLRAEVARHLLRRTEITPQLVADIKDKIRLKDRDYFAHLTETQLRELEELGLDKNDMFVNWQKPWRIFHTFFYRMKWGTEKETVERYLEDICNDLLEKLNLPDYQYHWVDFQGPTNFGSDHCWIALYPKMMDSHRDAYQFFARLGSASEAGIVAGSSLKSTEPSLVPVHDYSGIVNVLKDCSSEIIRLNKQNRNYFKFAPGTQATQWDTFYQEGIAAVDYSHFNLGDISAFTSLEQLNTTLGLPEGNMSNQSWNLWLFRTAHPGDVLFAAKGSNTCIGIGIIEGEYYYDEDASGFNHRRKVNWITNKVYEYKQKHKSLFRMDTFSPTHKQAFILSEYARLYPELIPVFDRFNLNYNGGAISATNSVDEPVNEYNTDGTDADDTPINYWWLNANPRIWSINDFTYGQRQKYTTHNERGKKRRIYKYFEAVKPGDYVIGYESSPTKQIKALFQITKGLHITDVGEEIEFELIEKLEIPVHWNDLAGNPNLRDCEVLINNQGSLFKLTEEEFDVIREIIDNRNILTERQQEKGFLPYVFADDPDKPFISETEFMQIVDLLSRKKNIILQGPPGTGKTFLARKLAYQLIGSMRDPDIEMVQFHQSYSYEDFIQGIRPNTRGDFEIREGIFHTFCQRAAAHPERPFFFIIDEINRGNLSRIFGELMMLIEADKRNEKYALKLTYAEDNTERFYVPPNLYIIGTMNTADRSLAIVDYALRRRFAFVPLKPDYNDTFRAFLRERNVSNTMIEHICTAIEKVNAFIKEDMNLGEGFQIGHSYFCSFNGNGDEDGWWDDVLQYEIKPLLEEIWFDDHEKVVSMMSVLSR